MNAQLVEAIRPLRRAEYDRLVALGCFADEKLELLEGMLVPMSPQGGRHATCIQRTSKLLTLRLTDRADVRGQSPFVASATSEPEPDVAVVPPGDYVDQHPSVAFLIIEVADSSLAKDRAKAEMYAAAGVPEYWIVDLSADVVEVHRVLDAGRYTHVKRARRGESLSPSALPDLQLTVDEILPRR